MKWKVGAIGHSWCYASEGSALCDGAAVGRSGGDNPVRDGSGSKGVERLWKGLLVARPIVHNEQGFMQGVI
jgi:hypothetical protein